MTSWNFKVFPDGIGIKIDLTEDECDFLNSITCHRSIQLEAHFQIMLPELKL